MHSDPKQYVPVSLRSATIHSESIVTNFLKEWRESLLLNYLKAI